MSTFIELMKKQKQEEAIDGFLLELFNLTKDGPVQLSLTNLVKKHKLASNILQVIKSYNILFCSKHGPTKTYRWVYFLKPNPALVSAINTSLREKQKEYNDRAYKKLTENKKFTYEARVSNCPNKIKIDNKIYSKVLPKKPVPISVIKPVPTTLSEISMEKSLLAIKEDLGRVHVLDFESFCLSRAISEKIQYALIECQCIALNQGVGYEWVGGDVTLELIQKIIKIRHEYIGVMPDVPLMPKPALTKDQKKLVHISKYFDFLKDLYTLTNGPEIKISLQNMLRKYNIDNTFFTYVKENNLLIKNKDNKALYSWNKSIAVNIDLAQQVYDWCFEKRKFYTDKKKDSLILTNTEKKNIEKLVEENLMTSVPVTVGGDTKGLLNIQHNNKDSNNVLVVSDVVSKPVIKSEKEMKSALAEKFAKIGNYKMAEQLLDEILN